MDDKEKLSVGGYLFSTEKDAQLAEAEIKKIEYLEARMDHAQPENILAVYKKLLYERVFKTPIGFQYLKKIRDFLLEQEQINASDVPAIPLYVNFGGEIRETTENVKNRIKQIDQKNENRKDKLFLSVALNFMLIVAVIAMFLIALKSDNPNIINYKQAITNQYSAWEQELKEREEVIREKEKELFGQEWND